MLAAMSSSRARRGLAAAVFALTVLASACGASAPPVSGPSGVDELEIPTPSPAPGDFVAGVDNPWLPLATGSVREYAVSGDGAGTRTVTVVEGNTEIAGVPVTAVREATVSADGATVASCVDYVAQDRAGNVWLFGHDQAVPEGDGSWRAGVGGSEAGLLMPARPRLGDGFRQELAPGIAEDVARVESTDAARSTPAGDFDSLVHVVVTTSLSGDEVDRYYARGVGLVQEDTPTASVSLTEAP